MKRITAFLIAAALLLLSLAACAGGTEPAPTDGPDITAAPDNTAVPDVTADPYPTQDPERRAFDPDTDMDNMTVGMQFCRMIETEDAYYLINSTNGYLYYYDKSAEEGGVLCGKPECLHDEDRSDMTCMGLIGSSGSLACIGGKLWFVQQLKNVRFFGIFRMDLDGGNREMINSFEMPDELQYVQNFYYHRGYLYMDIYHQTVKNGIISTSRKLARTPIEGGDFTVLGEWPSSAQYPMLGVRFVGDDIFFAVSYDGTANNTEAGEAHPAVELYRWNELMTEPQRLFRDDEGAGSIAPYWMYADEDGTVTFIYSKLRDPSRPWDKENNRSYCRVIKASGQEAYEILCDLDIEEGFYITYVGDDLIVLMRKTGEDGMGYELLLLDFEGSEILRGELPLVIPYPEKPDLRQVDAVVGGREKLLICICDQFDNDREHPERSWFFAYDISNGEIREKLIGSNSAEIYHG